MMRNDLSGNIRRVSYVLISLIIVLFLHISYIQVIESNFLISHPLNRRSVEYEKKNARGAVLDRNGEKLAYSEKDDSNGYRRVYPYGAIMAHLIGYNSIKLGKNGIESSYNGYLSGLSNPDRGLGPVSQLFVNNQAYDVTLTIDASLQSAAYKALGNNRGAIVVIEPRSGAVLAMVSKPSFDPNNIEKNWDDISNSIVSPLLNRATNGLYPPGSIIKPMIAEAALAEKVVSLKETINCRGTLKIGPDYVLSENNNKAHGVVDLSKAIAVSCNVTFGSLALELGSSRIARTFDRYGFNKSNSREFNESASRLPDFAKLGDGDLAQVGIGQGSLLVTPFRMAMLASTFANSGTTMKPHIISRIARTDGNVIQNHVPEEWLKPLDKKSSDIITDMLVDVVESGTGISAQIKNITVAGKTGTAENPHGASHAWFIGFAPADNPEVAIAVIVENGGSGGGVAAPIARQVLLQALR
ncbi:peptidoglycan D,D-transpeptidase FtsI family protein [Dendrosporobacter sp. 1207_IL3150]|uniref:peptidoglycan D,D-transpeptidase FtsI family protein n=1 Tax=Dendrosporobacter sp. 1207_IL3150 TaxID=3084054 RepID=UPI002FDA3909